MNKEPNYPIKVVTKIFLILEILKKANAPLSITELSKETGIFPSSIHRILDTLKYWGYIEQDSESQKYFLGLKLVELGMIRLHQMNVFNEAAPFLKELAMQFNETVNLGVLDGGEVVYLDKVESTKTVKVIFSRGRRAPVHCTAIGKALLAFQSKAIRMKIIKEKGLKKFNKNTITDIKVLEKELEEVRHSGYSFDRGEQVEEAYCLAAPIFNFNKQVVAAISISVPFFRMDMEKQKAIISAIKESTIKISKRLGYQLY